MVKQTGAEIKIIYNPDSKKLQIFYTSKIIDQRDPGIVRLPVETTQPPPVAPALLP